MPVTPRFSLSQDAASVTLVVRVPYVRVGDAEVAADGCELNFFCKPYLLRLTLPGRLADDADERVTTVYDADDGHGTLTLTLPKAVPGEVFPDLDLVTRLLQPRATPPQRRDAAAAAAGDVVDLTHVRAAPSDDDDDEGGGGGGGGGASALQAQMVALSLGSRGGATAAPAGGPAPPPRRPLIEVLESTDTTGETEAAPPAAAPAAAAASVSVEPPAEVPQDAPVAPPAAAVTSDDDGDRALPPLPLPTSSGPRYGFNRGSAGVFTAGLREEMPGVVELPDPDATPEAARLHLREAEEEARWDPYRYAGDNDDDAKEDPMYQEAVAFKPWWKVKAATSSSAAASSPAPAPPPWSWSDEDAEDMRQLPRREFLVDGALVAGASSGVAEGAPLRPAAQPEAVRLLTTALIPLLAAYAYDTAATGGDPTCESSWTVAALSPLLSWLDDELTAGAADAVEGGAPTQHATPSVLQVVVGDDGAPGAGGIGLSAVSSRRLDPAAAPASAADACAAVAPSKPGDDDAAAADAGVHPLLAERAWAAAAAFQRRALLFPYLRRWDLGVRALRDAAALLAGGKRPVLRALLAVRRLLRGDEQRYLLARLYLDDYCVWVQGGVTDGWLAAAGRALAAVLATRLTKDAPPFAHWQLADIDAHGPDAVAADEGDEDEEDEEDGASD